MITDIPTIDTILESHAAQLGRDFDGYRHHTYRVANLCSALAGETSHLEKIAIAAAFHDLAIWTHGTFDYIQPSIELATAHLASIGRAEWTTEVATMIREHHKISAWQGEGSSLVEAFRRADWIDVTGGVLTFGLPRGLIRDLYVRWPDAGFHRCLVRLAARRVWTHPLSPLPMMRW